MSENDSQPEQPPPRPPASRPRRSIFLSALIALLGIVLLLPGLCSVVFGFLMLGSMSSSADSPGILGLWPLWLFALLLAALGLLLITVAYRR